MHLIKIKEMGVNFPPLLYRVAMPNAHGVLMRWREHFSWVVKRCVHVNKDIDGKSGALRGGANEKSGARPALPIDSPPSVVGTGRMVLYFLFF